MPRLRPLDVMTLGYLTVVAILVTLFHARVAGWWQLVGCFVAAAAVAVGVVAAHERCPGLRWLEFARWAYPLFFALALYEAVGRYALILRGHFLDAGMNAWEEWAFRGHPNIVVDRLASRPLTELLYLCYFGFYLFFLIPPLVFFFRRRIADMERYVFTLMAALYTCYLGFLVVPLAGPGTSLAGRFVPASLSGYVVVPLQKFIMANGDPAGACFPSAHVAGAWAATLVLGTLAGRRVFLSVLPLTIGLTVAVVYTRYHYMSDALAGFAVAIAVFALTRRSTSPAASPSALADRAPEPVRTA